MTIAQHNGTVTKSESGKVTVQIEAQSACSSCEAHGKCGFAESKAKEVEISTSDWQQYRAGDRVTVGIDKSLGLKAATIAYILPGLLIVAIFVAANHWLGDLWSAVVILAFVALYWGAIALAGKRLNHQFSFHLTHQE